jgi:putative ABC transport system permease protein
MLNRKLVREVIRSYGLLLLVASIIAVGITCYVALQSAYHNLDLARQRYYRQCRMADFWIDLKKMPVAELDNLYRVDGVSEVHSRIQSRATVDLPDMDVPINAQVISLPDRRSAVINDIILRRGEYFGEGRRNEVIVSEKFALANEIAPGSTIHLLLNNRRQELIVVGTAISNEFTYLVSPGSWCRIPSILVSFTSSEVLPRTYLTRRRQPIRLWGGWLRNLASGWMKYSES